MPGEVDVTIAICTRNRASELELTLTTLCALTCPADLTWELVVIDNGSTDQTPDVLERFATRLPIRMHIEQQPGLSNARNCALRNARGRYVIWTDDDVNVHADWLSAYVQAFRCYPDVDVFGGTIEPVLMAPRAPWFAAGGRVLSGLMAERRPNSDAPDIGEEILPFGANFAVKTEILRKYNFDPSLGITPGRRRGGEETHTLLAILRAGGKGRWVPEACVEHRIPASNQTLAYVSRFYRSEGDKLAFQLSQTGELPRVRLLSTHAGRAAKRYILFQLTRNRPASIWLDHYVRHSISMGFISHLIQSPLPFRR